ncbi:MAG: acetyl-CoA C-acyltransferase FadI [Gemmatimonadetes bacterium]|nr:acetyl-CoA C-acyltransferase FadI [Gemmatimonadota bacterium]
MTRERIGRRVAIVEGCRTPFCKAGTAFRSVSPMELGKVAVREVLGRAEFEPADVDEIVYGIVVPQIQAPNVAREVGLAAGLPPSVPAYTVSKACASANQAITSAAETIALGNAEAIVAGGTEVLSDVPMLLSRRLRDSLVTAAKAKSVPARVRALSRIRPRDLAPVAPAIAEPSTGESMGESAERMAKENGITREAQDAWALRSHRLAHQGTVDGRLREEQVPVWVPPDYAQTVTEDNGVRADTSLEKLAALPPVFDRVWGSVTAGNSSPLTDGASALLLMSEERAAALGYAPLGYIRSWAYAALSPAAQLLQGPAWAVPKALDRGGVTMTDIELWEMHEAFAAQVLSNLQALDSDEFARTELGRSRKVGILDEDRINVMGGSIAIGHPFGATGGRLTVTLLREMRRRGLGLGLVSVCAAGAIGFAMVLER